MSLISKYILRLIALHWLQSGITDMLFESRYVLLCLYMIESYPHINNFLARVKDDLQALLPDTLLGIYVWGSLVTNSYQEGLSDIDVLIVLRSDVDDKTISHLKKWADTVLQQEVYAAKLDAVFIAQEYINSGDGTTSQGCLEFWKGQVQKTGNCLGDNPLVLDMIRKTGVCLVGPAAQEVIEPISGEKINNALQKELHAIQNGLQKHFDDLGWRYYAISTLCRIAYTYEMRDYVAKKEALLWYRNHAPAHVSLIDSALAYHDGDSADIKKTDPDMYRNFISEIESRIG